MEFQHPTAILANITEEKLDKVREEAIDHNFLIDRESLYDIIGDAFKLEIKESNIKEEKNVRFTNFRYGGEYNSGNALIIDDEVYEDLKINLTEKSIKKLHLMNVKNKDIAFNELINYLKDANSLDNSYWNKGNIWGGKISDDEKIISLNRIGILQNEIKTLIRKELSITFFTPIIVGGSLGIYFLYIMVSNLGMTELLMSKALVVLLMGFIIQVLLYLISLRKYFKEVVNNIKVILD